MSNWFVVNMEVCEMKEFGKEFTKPPEKTVEDVEKALKDEKGVSDPCVVLVEGEEEEDGTKNFCFVYFNIDAPRAYVGGAAVPSSAPAAVRARIISRSKNSFFNKIQAISYCFDALPLMKDALMKKYCLPASTVGPSPSAPIPDMPDAQDDKKNYDEKVGNFYELVESIKDIKGVTEVSADLDKIIVLIHEYTAKYVNAIPELKKIPYPGPQTTTPSPGPNPDVEKLKKQLADKEKIIKDMKDQMKDALKLKGDLSDDDMVKELKKLLEKNKPRAPFFDDPGVKGKEMTFKPEKFVYDYKGTKEDRVVFKYRPSTYRFFFIRNDVVKSLGLDPTKPVTCVIVDTEHHCSTDQPQEIPFTKEYNMTKGEDYFLCEIKDPKQ